ncbi:amino acid adenylation domain-containing protein [Pseudoalteromonas rhizosphaerae]|uniref:amino acid adenylation domain-containing protein n=1 Tax=Pseudoalteromonas rhizosphaerae TaxID=2518973 RepID=UPI003850E504
MAAQNLSNLAYVIYTSGSTGKPKGVMIEHLALLNRIDWMDAQFKLKSTDKILQKTPFSFDVSIWELIWPLSYGAQLVIAKPDGHKDAKYLNSLIKTSGITITHFVPSMLSVFLEMSELGNLSSLRYIICSGEALLPNHVKSVISASSTVKLYNLYGPTEAAIDVSCYACKDYQDQVPIGKAIQNTKLLVLDCYGALAPQGAVGEIHIEGVNLARGYLNLSELTSERFITNPLNERERLYKTGDLGRYDEEGNLQFLGRLDDQIKLRGYRIELGEIEQKILSVQGVDAALVMLQGNTQDAQQLVGYIVSDKQLSDEELGEQIRVYLEKRLPEYMVPSNIVMLPMFPLTANGKINKKALPMPNEATGCKFVAATSETQQVLVQIWSELLAIKSDEISITDNFFRLGGHSLLAVRFASRVRDKLSKELRIAAIFELGNIEALSHYLDDTHEESQVCGIPTLSFERRQTQGLSFSQQRLWFLDKLQGRNLAYNMPVVFEVSGHFDCVRAELALKMLMERHEILRTIYSESEHEPIQTVLEEMPVPFVVTHCKENDRDVVNSAIAKITQYQFELSKDAPIRMGYIAQGSDKGVLVINMHHIASDGWSMGLLVREFAQLYRLGSAARPERRLQYGDYVHWQRQHLTEEVINKQLKYWQKQLEDVPQVHRLPLANPRKEVKGHQGALVSSTLDLQTVSALESLSQKHGLTMFMLLQGVFSLVLSRYSYSQDVVMGTPIANRQFSELEEVIGCFVNTLVLRTSTDFTSLRDYFIHIKDVHLQAQANQDVPFEKLVEMCGVERSAQHSPLIQIMFSQSKEDDIAASGVSLPDVQVKAVQEDMIFSKFDLEVSVSQQNHQQVWHWVYDSALFTQEQIMRLSEHTSNILKQLATKQVEKMSDIAMLSAQELNMQLASISSARHTELSEFFVHELVSQQAARSPDKTALVFEQTQMSYGELEVASNQFAHYLRGQGVGTDILVGLCVERSLEMVVGILGILKAGGAYVPLEPSYPAERLTYMIEDTGIDHLVCQESTRKAIAMRPGMKVISLDDKSLQANLSGELTSSPARLTGQSMSSLAYLIYTSGSTGKPKGVMIEHKSATNFISAINTRFAEPTISNRRVLSTTTYSFDIFFLELFASLCFESRVEIASSSLLTSPCDIINRIEQHDINFLQATPSMWSMLLDQGWMGKKDLIALCGGEKLFPQLAEKLAVGVAELWNCYGPTEATVWSMITRVFPKKSTQALLITNSLENYGHIVLTGKDDIVPIGGIGELAISGMGLARGYLNRESLTEERFIHLNRYGLTEKLYKTGDLVKLVGHDKFEFIGRVDDQVKVRGHRIELGEVEFYLNQHESVQRSFASVEYEPSGTNTLIAYVKFKDDSNTKILFSILRAYLESVLPKYMQPDRLVIVKDIPLTPNNKVDKKALANVINVDMKEFKQPRTAIETELASIWIDLLGVEQVSVIDNFFELGGHSLLLMKLISAIQNRFEIKLDVATIIQDPTIEQLEKIIENKEGEHLPIQLVPQNADVAKLSYAQNRMWVLSQLTDLNTGVYNTKVTVDVKPSITVSEVEQALQLLVQKHDILSTCIQVDGNVLLQKAIKSPSITVVEKDFIPRATDRVYVHRQLKEIANIKLSLSDELPFKAFLLRMNSGLSQVQLVIHHIAVDQISLKMLEADIDILCNNTAGTDIDYLSTKLPLTYRDYVNWEKSLIDLGYLDDAIEQAKEQIKSAPQIHAMPTDKARKSTPSYEGKIYTKKLPKELVDLSYSYAQSNKVSLFNFYYAMLSLFIHLTSKENKTVIGAPSDLRFNRETEGLVGCFSNTLLLIEDFSKLSTFDSVMESAKYTLTNALANRHVPFDLIVEKSNPVRHPSCNPIFQIMLNHHKNVTSWNGNEFHLKNMLVSQSKFDLTLHIIEQEEDIYLSWEYAVDLWEDKTIGNFDNEFENLLNAVLNNNNVEINSLLSPDKLCPDNLNLSLIPSWTSEQRVDSLFSDIAAQYSNCNAISFKGHTLSYKQLHDRVKELANMLNSIGFIDGKKVAILMDKSPSSIITMLACAYNNAPYIPLDFNQPVERTKKVLSDSDISGIVANDAQLLKAKQFNLPTILLDNEYKAKLVVVGKSCSKRLIESERLPSIDDALYIMYTSGSTGKPKGACISHKNVLSFVEGVISTLTRSVYKNVFCISEFSFDITVAEIYGALLTGGCLHIFPSGAGRNIPEVVHYLSSNNLSLIQATPTVLKMIKEVSDDISYDSMIIVGGEALDLNTASWLQSKFKHVYQCYGPTECCVWTMLRDISIIDSPQKIFIGDSLKYSSHFIINKRGQYSTSEEEGELCIAGHQVGLGYYGEKHNQNDSFFTLKLRDGSEVNCYKTGDIVEHLGGDVYRYLGRKDDQVKINGVRIELSDISRTAAEIVQVRKALASLKNNKVFLHYELNQKINVDVIKQYLQKHLPRQMLPNFYVEVDQWPINTNGKIDKSKLCYEIDVMSSFNDESMTEDQSRIAVYWKKSLGIEELRLSDNFFSLGGNSLKAVQLTNKLKSAGYDIDFNLIFSTPHFKEFCDSLNHVVLAAELQQLKTLEERGNNDFYAFNSDNSLANLWLVPALHGGKLAYQHMAPYLKDKYNVKCLVSFGEELNSLPKTDMKSIVDDYISKIMKYENSEVINLLGFSFGGMVAFEVASKLESKGKLVNLIMFESDFMVSKNLKKMNCTEVIKHMLRAYSHKHYFELIDEVFIKDLYEPRITGKVLNVFQQAEKCGDLDASLWELIFVRMRMAVSNTVALQNYDFNVSIKGDLIWVYSLDQYIDENELSEAKSLFDERVLGSISMLKGHGVHSLFTSVPMVENNVNTLIDYINNNESLSKTEA